MKYWEQLKTYSTLFRNLNKFRNLERNYSDKLNQCAVVAILKMNPSLASSLDLKNSENTEQEYFVQNLADQFDALANNQLTTDPHSTSANKSEPVLELLFNQRAVMQGSRHSGQICYPGGALDQGETDLQGGVREV